MPVVREFTLPDLGEGLTGAEVVRWMVEVGEVIVVDQPVVEVETAKAVVEVPCPYGGVVTARFGEVGEEVPVGAPLVTVAVSPERTSGCPAGRTSARWSGTASPTGRRVPGAAGSGRVARARRWRLRRLRSPWRPLRRSWPSRRWWR